MPINSLRTHLGVTEHYAIQTIIVMVHRSRCRRSRFASCLAVLTVFVYALLNVLTSTSNDHQWQREQRAVMSDGQQSVVIANSSSSNTRRTVPIASLRLSRKFSVQETTELFYYSTSKDATVDDIQADTGMEQEVDTDMKEKGHVTKKGHTKQQVKVDVGMERERLTTKQENEGQRTTKQKGQIIKQRNVEQRVRREVSRLHLRPPKSVKYSHGQWQIVDFGRQVYVYSAFYDSRPDIDLPQVRIIAVAEHDVYIYGLCCLLWYRSQRPPDVVEISVLQTGPMFDGHTILEHFIFSCRLGANKTDPPTSVSLISPRKYLLSNLLPVAVPERPKHVIEFGHCMSILYWKQDPVRLVEWLEAHRVWGVGEVSIYATRLDNVTDSVLRRYENTGYVRYRQSTGPLGDDDEQSILLSMSPVINDCMYRNMYRYRYVVCTDADEMIVPASPHQNYSQMLRAAAAVATQTNAVVHSYLFRNTYFFLDFGATEKEPWYLLSQRSGHVLLSKSNPLLLCCYKLLRFGFMKLEIRSVERGICPIASSTMNCSYNYRRMQRACTKWPYFHFRCKIMTSPSCSSAPISFKTRTFRPFGHK